MERLLRDLRQAKAAEALVDDLHRSALAAELARDPQAFLKRLETTPDAAAVVAKLVKNENAAVVALVCTETILSAGPQELYVLLFLHLTKYDVPDIVPTLLPLLALPFAQRATLCLMVLVKKGGGRKLVEYMQDNISNLDFAVLAAAFETFLPLVPELVSVYTSRDCERVLLERATHVQDRDAVLRVVLSSCIDEAARKFNTEHYLPLLVQGARVKKVTDALPAGNDSVQALSLLCIVKLWNFTAVEAVMPLELLVVELVGLFLKPVDQAHQYLLEAFTYLLLGLQTRKALREDADFTNQLVLVMETKREPHILYAGLLTLANLTRPAAPSAASNIKAAATKEEESPQEVRDYDKTLVEEYKLVQTLCAVPLQSKDANLALKRVEILHNLCILQNSSLQRSIVAQGALPVFLKYLIENYSKKERPEQYVLSCRGLANLCRLVDPKLAFSQYDVKTCVPFLTELRSPENSPEDRLYALLALTNVSSLSEPELHALIIRKTADELPSLFLDPVPELQKAAWELVNNLITHPLMLAKFFNAENVQSRKNLDLLVKMLHLQDAALQVTIAGILANATMEYGLVCTLLLKQSQLFSIVADILESQAENDDLVVRVVSLLYSLKMVDPDNAVFSERALRDALGKIKTDDVSDMVQEIL